MQQIVTGTILPFLETGRNQELFLSAQGLARGLGSMTATHMEQGAKPPGSFLSTPCFLPIKRLRLRALGNCSCWMDLMKNLWDEAVRYQETRQNCSPAVGKKTRQIIFIISQCLILIKNQQHIENFSKTLRGSFLSLSYFLPHHTVPD